MNKLKQLKERALQNPQVQLEYDKLEGEFQFIDTLLKMRNAAGLTQEELALRMGTQKSNVSRLEKGGNPSWGTLRKYAQACGFELSMSFQQVVK